MDMKVYTTVKYIIGNTEYEEVILFNEFTYSKPIGNFKFHSLTGPAIIHSDGDRYFYIDGRLLTVEQYLFHDLISEETIQDVLTKWL